MEVVRFEEAEKYQPEEDWNRTSLAGSENFSFEWFDKPPGHSSPMHRHENEQVTVVLEGEFTVYTEEEEFKLEKFDSVHFPANEPHRIENSGEGRSVGLDIFAPARSFDFWLNRTED